MAENKVKEAPEGETPEGAEGEGGKPKKKLPMMMLIAGAVALVLVLGGGGGAAYFFLHRRAPKLTEKDTIVLADFTNTTGDPVFDGTLRQGLSAQLEQSPFLNLLSDDRIAQAERYRNQRNRCPRAWEEVPFGSTVVPSLVR